MKKIYAIILAVGFLTMGALEANGSATIEFQPPKFTREPKDLTVKEGEQAVWSFEVSGIPEPSIDVLKNGRPIDFKVKGRFQLIYNYPLVTFKIFEVYMEDEGEYTFKLTNAAGTASKRVKLTVEE